MAFDYAEMQGVAGELLGVNEFGKVFNATRFTGGGTAADGSDDRGTGQAITYTGVSVPYTSTQRAQSTVQNGDIQLIVDAQTAPKVGDAVSIDGKAYSIVDFETKKPADIVLCYFLQLRA